MPLPNKTYTWDDNPPNTNVIHAPEVNKNFDDLWTYLQAGVDTLNPSLAAKLGGGDSSVRRGAVNIAATESRTNTVYGTLTTPDKVSSVVLPTNGLIVVAYQATWQESVSGAARAAIFIGSNQLQASGTPSPGVLEAALGGTAGRDASISSSWAGLTSLSTAGGTYTGDATTGQVIGSLNGGPCHIFTAAGTYDISVQFKASSGSVTAKNRRLWVWTIGF